MFVRAKLLAAGFLSAFLLQAPMESSAQPETKAAELPTPAQQAIDNMLSGGRQIVHGVIVHKKRVGTKYEYGITPYRRAGQPSGDLIPSPSDVDFTVQGHDDPNAKEITINGRISKDIFNHLPGNQPREPVTVSPSVLIQVGDSTCFWNCRKSGGSTTCEWTCVPG